MYITLSELLDFVSMLVGFGATIFLLAKFIFENKKK